MNSPEKLFIKITVLIPIVNILLDIAMTFLFQYKTIIGFTRILFLFFILSFFIIKYGLYNNKLNRIIVFFISYIFIISLFSSNYQNSLIDGVLKIAFSLMMLPIGIKLGELKINYFNKIHFWLIVILLTNYLLAQVYKIGVSVYEEDTFYIGGATAAAPVIIVIGILVSFYSLNKKREFYNPLLNIFLIVLASFYVILSFKRGAILSLVIGFISFIYFSKKKIKNVYKMSLILIITTILIFNYSDTFIERYEARTTEKNEIENESRYLETIYVIKEFKKSNIISILFGKEPFNSPTIMKKYFGRPRMLHVDYNILLHGTGVLGFTLYALFYLRLFIYLKKLYKFKVTQNQIAIEEIRDRFALIVSLLILSLIMSFSGGLQFISYRVILFLTIGVYIGELNSKSLYIKD